MGRYTTVQAYADNNDNMRSISYDQATGKDEGEPKAKGLKVDKVDNPYGSTAGAGSGEFHVYRHARAREMARWKKLDEEEKEEQLEADFKEKAEEYKTEEDHKTDQRRKKRQRQKESKERKKNLKLAGVTMGTGSGNNDQDDDEFTYTPLHIQKESPEDSNAKDEAKQSIPPEIPFANDGSFLEMMKKKMEEESKNDDKIVPPTKKPALANTPKQ